MKIADLEEHHSQYGALESRIRAMVEAREFPEVFSACEQSFPHIVPAIQFRKKRSIEPETPALLAFTIVCSYGPPLFAHSVIESLLNFVRSTRLLAKHENGYLEAVEAALEREEVARVLWNQIEKHAGFLQRDIRKELGCGRDSAVAILETWEHLGVIVRRKEGDSYCLFLRTRLNGAAEGMCQTCGVRGKGRKELFLKPISCKQCGTQGYYHICSENA